MREKYKVTRSAQIDFARARFGKVIELDEDTEKRNYMDNDGRPMRTSGVWIKYDDGRGIPIEVTIFSKVKKRMQEMKRFFKEQGLELARMNQYGVFATAN
jgi:hypothetical protein